MLLTSEMMSIDCMVKMTIVPRIWRDDQPPCKWGTSRCQTLFPLSSSTTSTTCIAFAYILLHHRSHFILATSHTPALSLRSGTTVLTRISPFYHFQQLFTTLMAIMNPNVRLSSRASSPSFSQLQSYQAHIAGQAGPDNPYRFDSAPSKHIQHLAKIAHLGDSVRASGPDTGPLVAAISPYDNPYTAITRPVAKPSIGASTPTVGPVLAIAGPVPGPSNVAAEAATSPSVAPVARPVTPALSAGGDSISSSPTHSTSRSPSPDAVELISSLASYESLSDDALYDAALNAQQAMVKWQDEYMALKTQISHVRGSPYSKEKRKANPRKLEDPEVYDWKHHDFLQQALQQATANVGQTTGKNPINKPPFKGHKPRNELHIDMNEPMQPVEGKRIRKPRIIDDDEAAVPAPKKSTRRAREPENDGITPAVDQPAAKKQHTRARSITPPEWVNTARNIKSESKEPSAPPENAPQKRGNAAKCVSKLVVKKEATGETKGKDPVRAAAARLMWAKRQANGTNGRHGGAPKDGTVAKARGR